MKNYIVLIFVLIGTVFSYSQNGTIRGEVYNSMTVEPVKNLTVKVVELDTSSTTDLDGAFNISVEPGVYTLLFSANNFVDYTIEEVEVKNNEVNYLGEVFMDEDFMTSDSEIALSQLVVKANSRDNTETALLKMKKKSVKILDGISAAKMELAGDGNAVDAAKRVTGVSVEGGKYVYIRGLGDRYSKTTLNGFDIPGLDPDKNTVQMDIFPTSLMDNVMVSKNFTADQPADFTGGIMNIETKDFPNKKFTTISAGIGYNPDMHFNGDYINYEGGKTDFLGFDDGTRDLPSSARTTELPFFAKNSPEEISSFMGQFNGTLAPEKQTSFMDFDFSVSTGDQISLNNNSDKKRQLGYVFSISYKNKTKFYDDLFYGQYVKDDDPNEKEMLLEKQQSGSEGVNSVLMGVLGGLAYKTNNSKYAFNIMHLQNGEKTSSVLDIEAKSPTGITSQFEGFAYNLEYNQKSLTNFSLSGTHDLDASDWEITWGVSPTISKSKDPDVRRTPYDTTNGYLIFNPGGAGSPIRIWRDLNEYNIASKLDFTKNMEWFNNDAKLKFGLSNTYKDRDYEILNYGVQFWGNQRTYFNWTGNGNEVLSPENLASGRVYLNTTFIDEKINPNEYKSNSNTIAGYISTEFNPIENLKAIFGVRAEQFMLNHTGRPVNLVSEDQILDNEEVLNSLDFFPSANLILAISDDMNLRGSYSKTIARPSFKEMSYAQILDPISQTTFNGGLLAVDNWDGNLSETRINNFDLRWEYYLNNSEMFSISGFYKTFQDPIELVMFSNSNQLNFQPRNVGDGSVLGGEFEFRKNFGFLSEALENLSLSTNVTLVKSEIEMTEMEYNAREAYKKTDEKLEKTRDMAGQAPYIINTGLTYNAIDSEMELGLFYNVKGHTLYIVGGDGLRPDIYTAPFHNMNFSIVKKFGNSVIDFKVDNILGDKREDVYRAFGSSDGVFEGRSPGRTFSLGYKIKF